MMHAYVKDGPALKPVRVAPGNAVPPSTVWVDMHDPDADEVARIKTDLGIEVPTQEQMQEIEVSARLYRQDDQVFMTANVVASSESERPQLAPFTFILTPTKLVTVRHIEPRPFTVFAGSVAKSGAELGPRKLLVNLLEAIVYRAANILEEIASEVDHLSRVVFEPDDSRPLKGPDFRRLLSRIARHGDLDAKVRESLTSIGRLPGFLLQSEALDPEDPEGHAAIESLEHDITSLADYCSFLANKINFLLDATMGLINIDQNATIKIFSLMAVVLLPPTMIASIYGMNFQFMPELEWAYGYPMALVIMLASAVLPYLIFKYRGWF